MFEKLTRSRYMTENVTDELIRLENLVKIYDTGAIRVMGLKKINLTIHRGEFVRGQGRRVDPVEVIVTQCRAVQAA